MNKNSQWMRRIERKCNRILKEIASLRRCYNNQSSDIDTAIERMHHNAKAMQQESDAAARLLARFLRSPKV